MKVLVCGGRNWVNRTVTFAELNRFHAATPIDILIHGDARGADSIAGEWAKDAGVKVQAFPAAWDDLTHPDAFILKNGFGKRYDAKAGSRRNLLMADQKPDVVLAFPGGKGTRNMVNIAKGRGIRVVLLPEDDANR